MNTQTKINFKIRVRHFQIFKFSNWLIAFIYCLLPTANSFSQSNRLWATYYGGTEIEEGYSVATDASGNVYLAGYTRSTSGMASGGFQNTFGGATNDAFLVKFDGSGNRLWATYYGGPSEDYGQSTTTDASGNVYLSGYTVSAFGIASGGFQNTYAGGGNFDAFLVKFSPTGGRLWATYYGGAGLDLGYDIATDAFGNVYLVGWTSSTSGIASGGFQNIYGGGGVGAFLVKFSTAGARQWATYYGGTGIYEGYGTATDASGNVYLSGYTNCTSGIASGGFQNTIGGGWEASLVKFSATGGRLWATYYGGTGDENGNSVVSDASGNVYLAGKTSSSSGIASGGFQNTYGGAGLASDGDAFLVKFNSSGSRLWATYYGGAGDEEVPSDGLATDAAGNVYLAGDSYSTNNIASGGFQNSLVGSENPFVATFDASGNRLCSTYYGKGPGSLNDENGCVAVDNAGNVYLGGLSNSATGIASGGFQNTYAGNGDPFLVKLTSCASLLPVEWLYFNAAAENNSLVRCQWSTASEINSDYFAVERSKDGIIFSQIGTVKGAGNSSTIRNYEFIDAQPPSPVGEGQGVRYYRLRQLDFNSQYEYSPIRVVYIGSAEIISIYPNPSTDGYIQYSVTSTASGEVRIKIYDVLGREVLDNTETLESGVTIKRLNTAALTTGNYLLRITTSSQEKTQKQFVIK